jgi:hypothetical protein
MLPAAQHAVSHAALVASSFGARASNLAVAGAGAPVVQHIYLDGAIVGPGAVKEINKLTADGMARQIRDRTLSRSYAGAKLG